MSKTDSAPRRLAAVAALALAAGCGGSGAGGADSGGGGTHFDPSVTCGVAVTLSGAIDASITPSDPVTCTTPLASKAHVESLFAQASSADPSLDLSFAGLTKGQTGSDLAGTLDLHQGQMTWTSGGCTVQVSSNDLAGTGDLGDNYRIEGSASCTTATSNLNGDVQVGPIDFVATVTWP